MDKQSIETLRELFETIRDERAIHANTATRIGNAFLAILSYLKGAPFLRKDRDDRTEGSLEVGGDISGNSLNVAESVKADEIFSHNFIQGLYGSGFGITKNGNGEYVLTIDNVVIRQTITALALSIDKVRSVGGQIVVSAANGKIATVGNTKSNGIVTALGSILTIGGGFITQPTQSADEDCVVLTFEGSDPTGGFKAGDYIRCATFENNVPHGYWVEVDRVDNGKVYIQRSEFDEVMPQVGDECVLMGSATDANRQNLILISATEDGQPRIDVMNGVKEKNFNNALRVRLGNLDGITDSAFPNDLQPNGDGLYADNVFLKGQFVLVNADGTETDISSALKVVNGIHATVENIQRGGNNLLIDTAFERELNLSVDGKDRRYMNEGNAELDGNVRGYNAVKITENGRTEDGYKGTFYYRIAVKPNTTYTYSCWYKLEASATDSDEPTFRTEAFKTTDGARDRALLGESKDGATDWVQYAHTFTTPADTTEIEVTSFVLKNGTLWLAGQMLNEGETALPWSRSAEDALLQSKEIASLSVTQDEIKTSVQELREGQEAIGSQISQTVNAIKAEVRDENSKAGMEITAEGVEFTADKFLVRSTKIFDEDGKGRQIADIYEDEHGYAHLRLAGPDGNETDVSWKGFIQTLVDTIQASMTPLGAGLVATNSITLDARNFVSSSYFTYLGVAYRFMAMRTKNADGVTYVVGGYGAEYDGKYFANSGIDNSNNQPSDTTPATDGIYFISATAWLEDMSTMGPSVGAGGSTSLTEKLEVKQLNFAKLVDNSVTHIAVEVKRRVIDGAANTPYFGNSETNKTYTIEL